MSLFNIVSNLLSSSSSSTWNDDWASTSSSSSSSVTVTSMIVISIVMAIGWGVVLEISKRWLYKNYLPSTSWWHTRAVRPTTQMMQNFGYPTEPTRQFPNAVTEEMARDFYAYLSTLCAQHFVSALLLVPVVWYGWDGDNTSDTMKTLFLLGTLSDVGFDIYDATKLTARAFFSSKLSSLSTIPIDFWVVVVPMHHVLAMSLVIPMNLYYIDLPAYHQTALSLLMASSLCYSLGNYKFSLDVQGSIGALYQYKACVLIQFGIILYTRIYLWFPAMATILKHFYDQNDMTFFYFGSAIGLIFSIFNMVLLADGCKAAFKWLPRSFSSVSSSNKEAASTSDGSFSNPVSFEEEEVDEGASFSQLRRLSQEHLRLRSSLAAFQRLHDMDKFKDM